MITHFLDDLVQPGQVWIHLGKTSRFRGIGMKGTRQTKDVPRVVSRRMPDGRWRMIGVRSGVISYCSTATLTGSGYRQAGDAEVAALYPDAFALVGA